MDLKSKTIFITGAARRIGRSLALAVASQGADLVLHHHHSVNEMVELKGEIEDLGRKATIVHADFSDPASIHQLTDEVFARSEIYGVINNAAIFMDLAWSNTSLVDWERHFAVNLTAPFLICQAFGKHLQPGQHGRVINMLDWRALRPGVDHFPYTISKAALSAMTISLAQSLAPQINVNGIALGAILPPTDGSDTKSIVTDLPNPRWADLSEVAATVMFLLTGPNYVTGEIIHLDGGRHLV
jgi:NAD(P)-dependent dehydrogenase (short-subunit alcohol dehydrogenase family)